MFYNENGRKWYNIFKIISDFIRCYFLLPIQVKANRRRSRSGSSLQISGNQRQPSPSLASTGRQASAPSVSNSALLAQLLTNNSTCLTVLSCAYFKLSLRYIYKGVIYVGGNLPWRNISFRYYQGNVLYVSHFNVIKKASVSEIKLVIQHAKRLKRRSSGNNYPNAITDEYLET